ncbi:MAG: stage II sporulation protein M [Anaerolineales bacterium]|nr:stage II sporulation protein M [Anaerolineales bacterium]
MDVEMIKAIPANIRKSMTPALIITNREVRDQFRDWRIIFPVAALTLFFPWLMNFTAAQAVNFVQKYGAPIVAERLIPFLLMVVGFFPISVSLVIALESFVGEKERLSIEPLLSSPLEDWQLYMGKLLASMAPPLAASYMGIIVYLIGVYAQVGWTPAPILLLEVVLLTTMQAILMVSGAVVISAQTTSVRAANLLASFIIIPVALLIQGEAIIMFWARYSVLWWVIFGEAMITVMLVRSGVAHFNREELLGRELDVLNIKWGWRVFKSAFIGVARNPIDWYRLEIRRTLQRLWIPLIIVSCLMVAGIWVGTTQAKIFTLPPDILNLNNLDRGFIEGLEAVRFFSVSGIGMVWLHNLRVIALAIALGIFTFGVLGVLILMLPLAVIGYFMANVANVGLSPIMFFTALVLPHGIFEIPALVIVGASILQLGGVLLAPTQNKTVGEAWLFAFADCTKLVLGLVLPLLLVAATIEVLVTPQIAVLLLGS